MYKTNINHNLPEEVKYDPWEAKQEITGIRIEIHCSRYWMLSEWECENLSLPFWRLYHSRTGGSYVSFKDKTTELTNESIVLIPPYTAFSSYIKAPGVLYERIKGIRINTEDQIQPYAKLGLTDQFFVHFNLEYPYDKVEQGIYVFPLNEYWKEEMTRIETDRLLHPNEIGFLSSLKISGLIIYALKQQLPGKWNVVLPDKRIQKVLTYIDSHLSGELTVSSLSDVANLAANSLARLFKHEMQKSLHQYIQQKRIEKAVLLFHHSSLDIESIAGECGFYDRHHFSKVFKERTGFSPARYRMRVGRLSA